MDNFRRLGKGSFRGGKGQNSQSFWGFAPNPIGGLTTPPKPPVVFYDANGVVNADFVSIFFD